MKLCSSCKKVKSHKLFNRDKDKYDGLKTVCRQCDNAASAEWYETVGRAQRYPHLTLADAAA